MSTKLISLIWNMAVSWVQFFRDRVLLALGFLVELYKPQSSRLPLLMEAPRLHPALREKRKCGRKEETQLINNKYCFHLQLLGEKWLKWLCRYQEGWTWSH